MTNEDKSAIIGVSLHSYDTAEASDAIGKDTGRDTIVQQQYGDEVDVNTIVRRFGGLPVQSNALEGVYGDFSGIADYDSAVEAVERARAGFMTLPAEVRDKFGNSPGELVRMAQELSESEFKDFMEPPKVVAPVAPVAPVVPVVV